MRQDILLIDFSLIGPAGGGHSEAYFLKFLSILIQNNYSVYACSANNQRLREKIQEASLDKKCQVIDFQPTLLDKLLFKGFQLIDFLLGRFSKTNYIQFTSLYNLVATRRLRKNFGREIPVFFAHVDSILPAVPTAVACFFMPPKWTGLYVLPSYKAKIYFGSERKLRRFYQEKNLSLPSCQSLLVLHPLYQYFLTKHTKISHTIYLPELVEINHLNSSNSETDASSNEINYPLLEQIEKQAQGRRKVAILGNITPRKNILLFLKSVSLLDPSQYFIIILGRLKGRDKPEVSAQLPEIEEYQDKLSTNSYIDFDYFITSESEFSCLLSLSDVVFLHYRDHPYSSNMLTKAMAHRKPVIVNRGYLMEKTVKQYNWREVVEGNPDKIASVIQEISDPNFQIEEQSYQSFLEDHSPKSFEKSTLEAVNSLYQ